MKSAKAHQKISVVMSVFSPSIQSIFILSLAPFFLAGCVVNIGRTICPESDLKASRRSPNDLYDVDYDKYL